MHKVSTQKKTKFDWSLQKFDHDTLTVMFDVNDFIQLWVEPHVG